MRVALVTWGYMEYTLQLANALCELTDTYLIAPMRFHEFYEKNKNTKLKIGYFKMHRLRYPTNILYSLSIIHKIKKYHPDIIHIQEGNPWFSLFVCLLSKYPIVNTLHDPRQHIGEEKIRETVRDKIIKRFTTRYIVHGKKLREELNDQLKIPLEHIDVIPHGNFEILYKRATIKKDKFQRILFFGRIWPYKGLDYLIKAESLISKKIKNFKIVIAGTGEKFEKYSKLIKNYENFEIHTRYIKNEEIAQFFSQADVVVLPYIDGSQSGVIPLAYAYSKPVVATSVGSIPEILDDGTTGILVPPRDTVKLADAIVKILKNKPFAKSLGRAGYKKSKKELSWNKIAKLTMETYKKCLIA